MIYFISGKNNGVWHSLVVRLVRDQEAAGSNPVTPTSVSVHQDTHIFYICYEHSDQRQVAAPNHRGRAEQILAIYHDGEVRILTVSPDQQAVPAPKIGCSYCLFFCSSHDGEVCCEHSAKIGFESNLKPQTYVVFTIKIFYHRCG